MTDRPYIFFELTNSICSECLRKVEAKILLHDNAVTMSKWCPLHGKQEVLISTDPEYYKLCRNFLKPGQMPLHFNTPVKYGCPYDCGLCTDHEQHSCLSIIEITDRCNLTCPVCYAESSPKHGSHRTLQEIEFMLDRVVRNEGEPDVVQISGGEPTIHPDFFDILDLAKARPIKHLMVNTNGIRIAREEEFAARLAGYAPGIEIYLQFDSLEQSALQELRGANLTEVRLSALERLNRLNLSTTLVVTLKRGTNDEEIGKILEFALTQRCVRGVTFQPIQDAGRVESFDPAHNRLTLGEVRQKILAQQSIFQAEDIIPVPCHPDCIAMGYALKLDGKVTPLTRMIDPELLLQSEGSTIVYEKNPLFREKLFGLFSTAHSPESSSHALRQLLCCIPKISVPSALSYENIFRVIIMQFLDAWNFDVRSVKRSCVHIVHPDGRLIPFDTYNLFYRSGREAVIEQLRAEAPPVSNEEKLYGISTN